ncbi:hypothetical protein [Nocardiopsis kunsanensis]|uniref:Uncharacterized protein n=1 Tax=Nocardiopsis kunsanensis TaxID=141693 RepID=A0A918XD56_9ACTN|nr:hypothetical protein [Nocardiopsis kunsanensis]GHD27209.1 hypothetical protein GCM10007147_26080 [Nocardiopsis kunsanensis]
MSTSREDGVTDSAIDETPSPESRETDSPEEGAVEGGTDFLHGSHPKSPPRGGGVFSPEALSVTGLLLLLPVLVGGRLLERVAWFGIGSGVADAGQLALLRAEMLTTGAVAAVAVLLASVSLFTGNDRTRAWARWSASAVVLAGVLSLLMCLLAFVGIVSAG